MMYDDKGGKATHFMHVKKILQSCAKYLEKSSWKYSNNELVTLPPPYHQGCCYLSVSVCKQDIQLCVVGKRGLEYENFLFGDDVLS